MQTRFTNRLLQMLIAYDRGGRFFCGIQYSIQKLLFIVNYMDINNLCTLDKFDFRCFLIPITTLSEQCTVNEYGS